MSLNKFHSYCKKKELHSEGIMRLQGGPVFLFPVFGRVVAHPGKDLNHISHLHSARPLWMELSSQTDLIYHQWSQLKRAVLFKAPALLHLSEQPLCPPRPAGESDTRHDGSSAERSTKLLTSPWMSFSFCVCFLFGQTRPHWRDFEIFWPTDNTNRVVKQRGWFISSGPEECTLKTDKDGRVTDSPVNDVLWHRLDDWMCRSMKTKD